MIFDKHSELKFLERRDKLEVKKEIVKVYRDLAGYINKQILREHKNKMYLTKFDPLLSNIQLMY